MEKNKYEKGRAICGKKSSHWYKYDELQECLSTDWNTKKIKLSKLQEALNKTTTNQQSW